MDKRTDPNPEGAPARKAPRDAGIHLIADDGAGPRDPVVAATARPAEHSEDRVASVQRADTPASLGETAPFVGSKEATQVHLPKAAATTRQPALAETGSFEENPQATAKPAGKQTAAPQALQETGNFVDEKATGAPAKGVTATPASAKPAAAGGAVKLTALGDFKLLGKLGQGGMGVVYKARQVSLERDVALKVLSKQLADNADFVARFQREAKLMARLEHPNVLRCYAVGQEHGFHYFAMEFVDGASMESWLKKLGKLTVGDALHVILRCAEALQYAHEQGLVHRDIKPDNLLVTKKGVLKVADLGLAKATAEDVGLTRTGTGAGTPLYMSPEQARDAKHVDGRSDIYSMGCMLYAFLTGKTPFGGETYVEVIENKMKGKYPSARRVNDHVPPKLDLIIDKMMVPNPEQRYQSCAEIIRDLEGLGLANKTLTFIDGKNAAPATSAKPSAPPPVSVPTGPTRIDPKGPTASAQTSSAAGPIEEGPDVWYVQYKNAKGVSKVKKLTTAQVLDLIRDQRLDETDRASKSLKENFRSLAAIREFESALKHKILQERVDRKAAKFQGMYEKLAKEHDRYQRWKWIRNLMYTTGGWIGLIIWLAVIGGVLFGAYYVFTKWGLTYILETLHLKSH